MRMACARPHSTAMGPDSKNSRRWRDCGADGAVAPGHEESLTSTHGGAGTPDPKAGTHESKGGTTETKGGIPGSPGTPIGTKGGEHRKHNCPFGVIDVVSRGALHPPFENVR